jgi:hypothetical protein
MYENEPRKDCISGLEFSRTQYISGNTNYLALQSVVMAGIPPLTHAYLSIFVYVFFKDGYGTGGS